MKLIFSIDVVPEIQSYFRELSVSLLEVVVVIKKCYHAVFGKFFIFQKICVDREARNGMPFAVG
jgi:hypothetical protein